MYAKLINGVLEYAPQNKGAIINYNVNIELMVKDGYKEFFSVPRPEQTNRKYHIEYVEGKNSIEEMIVFDETQEEADEREQQEEAKRIGNLQCTKRVFVLMLERLGLDYFEQIEPAINANRQAKLEWELCVELERKNPLLDQLAAQFKVTSKQLDDLFKFANGEITQEEFLGVD